MLNTLMSLMFNDTDEELTVRLSMSLFVGNYYYFAVKALLTFCSSDCVSYLEFKLFLFFTFLTTIFFLLI